MLQKEYCCLKKNTDFCLNQQIAVFSIKCLECLVGSRERCVGLDGQGNLENLCVRPTNQTPNQPNIKSSRFLEEIWSLAIYIEQHLIQQSVKYLGKQNKYKYIYKYIFNFLIFFYSGYFFGWD